MIESEEESYLRAAARWEEARAPAGATDDGSVGRERGWVRPRAQGRARAERSESADSSPTAFTEIHGGSDR
jgi:hypothetical protein